MLVNKSLDSSSRPNDEVNSNLRKWVTVIITSILINFLIQAVKSAYNSFTYPVIIPASRSFGNVCGVIGGLGPKATVNFFDEGVVSGRIALYRAVKDSIEDGTDPLEAISAVSTAVWTREEVDILMTGEHNKLNDQDHIPLLILNSPQVPDRTAYILNNTLADPKPLMRRSAATLVRAGANCLCVICNTAHFFLDDVQGAADELAGPDEVEVLNMIELTLNSISARASSNKVTVGLLATTGTVRTRIYHEVAAKISVKGSVSIDIITPSDVGGSQDDVMAAIYGEQGIKAGYDDIDTDEGRNNFNLLINQAMILQDAGAVAIINGCTELPLVLTPERAVEVRSSLKIVNPTQVLADHVLKMTLTSYNGV